MANTEEKLVCLVCLKRFSGGLQSLANNSDESSDIILPLQPSTTTSILESDHHHQATDLYSRFLHVTGSYLKVAGSNSQSALIKQCEIASGKNVEAFCDQCQIIVRGVCDHYAELQAVKLKLLKKVEELEQVTRQSVECMSTKLVHGQLKAVAEELNVKSVGRLESFRESIVSKCRQKLNESVLKVMAPGGPANQEERGAPDGTRSSLNPFIIEGSRNEFENEILQDLNAGKRKRKRKVASKNFKTDSDIDRHEEENAVYSEDIDRDFTETEDNDSDLCGAPSPESSDSYRNEDNFPEKRSRQSKVRKTRVDRLALGLVKVICKENGDKDDDHRVARDPKPRTKCTTCVECGKTYKDAKGLKRHMDSIHTPYDQKRFACPHCPYRVHRPCLLKIHVLACLRKKGITTAETKKEQTTKTLGSGNRKQMYQCSICQQSFASRNYQKRHEMMHDPSNHIPCPEGCNRKFKGKNYLEYHLRSAHGKGDRFICSICGASYAHKSVRNAHELYTHGPRQFECDICHKTFKKSAHLNVHKRIHNPDQVSLKVICSECGKTFATPSVLQRHINSRHTPDDQKRFACPHCPYRQSRLPLFQMHLKACSKNKEKQ